MRRCSVNNNITSPCKLIFFLISPIGDRVIKNVDTFFIFVLEISNAKIKK